MKNYIELCTRTEHTQQNYNDVYTRIENNPEIIRLLHAFIGLNTENGELMDALKKHLFYGKELDLVNLIEELGDLKWYLSIAIAATANILNKNPEDLENEIEEININKLRARYPNKFEEINAINRNLELEREILENGQIS